MIYNLVDGTRTVQEIIDRSLLGKFYASEILLNLMEMGFVEVAGIRTPSLVKKVRMINFREAMAFVYYGAFLIFIFLLLVYFKPNFLRLFWDSKIERVNIEAPSLFVHRAQLDRIKNALDIFYLERGTYPQKLEELVAAQLLRKDDLFYRKGVSYQYELKEGKYILKH
jgi:hypothetical protein